VDVAPAVVVPVVVLIVVHVPFTSTSSLTVYDVDALPDENVHEVDDGAMRPEFVEPGSTQTEYACAPGTASQETVKPVEVASAVRTLGAACELWMPATSRRGTNRRSRTNDFTADLRSV
jgi:hypothetical protein